MTPRDAGYAAGVDDARAAWCGPAWKRTDRSNLPIGHLDRQEWLSGYAAGLAEYNRSIDCTPTVCECRHYEPRMSNGTR